MSQRYTSRQKIWSYLLILTGFGVLVYIILVSNSPINTIEYNDMNQIGQITVIMNTFKRPNMMEDAIDYYSRCKLVKYIYIIWSEKTPPDSRIITKYSLQKYPQVIFNYQEIDSLNSRFKPLPGPHTDSIFTVDDDMRVPCNDLYIAYETWKNSPNTLVGYMPRIHLRNKKNNSMIYRCWWLVWWHGSYSIILTKAAFMHEKFLYLYTNIMPKIIRDLVDKERNCEDIAMQFLISNTTKLPPIYVKGHLDDLGVIHGLSTNQNILFAKHMDTRSKCINELIKIYNGNPLIMSHTIVDKASSWWYNAPSTWYEYISSDLWKFN